MRAGEKKKLKDIQTTLNQAWAHFIGDEEDGASFGVGLEHLKTARGDLKKLMAEAEDETPTTAVPAP